MQKTAVIACAVLIVACASSPASAQILFGSIVGNVTDASGAAVPSAIVKITQNETNETRETTTNDAGGFTLSTVKAGTYRISILKDGFKNYTTDSVAVTLNTTTRIDAALQVGTQNQTVEITAESAILQTDKADVHGEFNSKAIVDLPQPSRTFMGVLALTPGVSPPGFSSGGNNNPGKSFTIRANGTSSEGTNMRIDGVSDTNPWVQFNQNYVPSMEAIQTVNMTTASADAEQGLGNGAAINVQTKSGTNQFHGSLYEYNIVSALKARPFFLAANQGIPKFIENDMGASLGGRIVKDRLFFFGSYEGDFISQAGAATNTLPLPAFRTGDFSGGPASVILYDPATGNADGTGKQLFAADPARPGCAAGKCIPVSRISPIVKKLLDLYPDPNQVLNGNPYTSNYYVTTPLINRLHRTDTKMDWNATSKLKFAGRLGWSPYIVSQQPSLGPVLGGSNFPPQSGTVWASAVNATYIISPTFVVDATWGLTTGNQYVKPVGGDKKLGSDFLGIPGVNLSVLPIGGGMPNFAINGYTTLGYGFTYYHYNDPVTQYTANATWIKGSHNVRFGVDIARQHMNHEDSRPDNFTFTGGVTAQGGANGSAIGVNQYNGFADFLLGLPNSYKNSLFVDPITLRVLQESLYIRDQWQVNHRLTVSIGTRWEYYPVPARANRGIEYFDLNTFQIQLCGLGGNDSTCGITTEKRLFSPRAGIAWRPSERTVIRTGFSLTPEQVNAYRDGMYSYPARFDYGQTANPSMAISPLAAGIPTVPVPNLSTGTLPIPAGIDFTTTGAAIPKNFVRGYTESWNFTVQRDLGRNFVAQIGYVGTHTLKMHTRYDINYAQVGGGNASRPFFSRNITGTFTDLLPFGAMKYHSAQATLQKRYSNGLSLDASYTFSKWTGLCCDDNSDTAGGPQIKIPQYLLLNRAVMPQDRTHNFRMSSTYELPFGASRRFVKSGFLAYVAGGWQLNGILSIYSGTPFSVTADGGSLNASGNTQRADLIKDHVDVYGTGNTANYFDTSAFAPVTTARFGTAGFDILRGPGVKNLDLSLFRSFRVTDRFNAQFRAEALNLTNTPHFSNPGSNVSASGFGAITSTSAPSRQFDERFLRLGLRISF